MSATRTQDCSANERLDSPAPFTQYFPMTSLSSIGYEFWYRLASFAFDSYLKHGIGVCILKEQPGVETKDAALKYLAYDPDNPDFDALPIETMEILDEYDPMTEVVLAIIDKDDKALVMQLSTLTLGVRPIQAYRRNQRKKRSGRWIPGELLSLKKDLPEIPRGQYVFLRRVGAMMELSPASIDPETDEICRTETVLKCHSDFEDCFMDVNGVIVGTKE